MTYDFPIVHCRPIRPPRRTLTPEARRTWLRLVAYTLSMAILGPGAYAVYVFGHHAAAAGGGG